MRISVGNLLLTWLTHVVAEEVANENGQGVCAWWGEIQYSQRCPSMIGTQFVSTSLQKYSRCPAAYCSIDHFGRGSDGDTRFQYICIMHWNHTCHATENGRNSCCPTDDFAFFTNINRWTNEGIDDARYRSQQHDMAEMILGILPNSFQRPNGSVFVVLSIPDPETDIPYVISMAKSSVMLSILDNTLVNPVRWTDTGTYFDDSQTNRCDRQGRKYAQLLFYYDEPSTRWVSLPNQTFANNIIDAWIPPSLFIQGRGKVFLSRVYTEIFSNNSVADYTLPECGRRKMLDVNIFRSFSESECIMPVRMDDLYNKMVSSIASTDMIMLGPPMQVIWTRSLLPPDGKENVKLAVSVSGVVADAMANKTGSRRSSSPLPVSIIKASYYVAANATWQVLSNCTAYDGQTRTVTCYLEQLFLDENQMQLWIALLSRNDSIVSQAFLRAGIISDDGGHTTTTVAKSGTAVTTTPSPIAKNGIAATTTPPPIIAQEERSNNIVEWSVAAAILVVASFIACRFSRKMMCFAAKERDYTRVHMQQRNREDAEFDGGAGGTLLLSTHGFFRQ